ncbi:hypothetical protein JHK87_055465 [Glycine soja]|nr:hypothetical protein JHK87_055465 [Glycine soja]
MSYSSLASSKPKKGRLLEIKEASTWNNLRLKLEAEGKNLSQTPNPEDVHDSCLDILSRDLGVLEYPGRLKTTRFGVTYEEYFPPQK